MKEIGAKAKLLSLLALLDVVSDKAVMADIAVEKVGPLSPPEFAGKMRLKFTVFGNESRLMSLATEISRCSGAGEVEDLLDSMIARDDKLRLALQMVDSWNEIAKRLLDERLLKGGAKLLTDGR